MNLYSDMSKTNASVGRSPFVHQSINPYRVQLDGCGKACAECFHVSKEHCIAPDQAEGDSTQNNTA
eukprot:5366839-Amphidinium_carterae.1